MWTTLCFNSKRGCKLNQTRFRPLIQAYSPIIMIRNDELDVRPLCLVVDVQLVAEIIIFWKHFLSKMTWTELPCLKLPVCGTLPAQSSCFIQVYVLGEGHFLPGVPPVYVSKLEYLLLLHPQSSGLDSSRWVSFSFLKVRYLNSGHQSVPWYRGFSSARLHRSSATNPELLLPRTLAARFSTPPSDC